MTSKLNGKATMLRRRADRGSGARVSERGAPRLVAEYVRSDSSVGAVAVCDAGLALRGGPATKDARRGSGSWRGISLGEPLLKNFVELLKLGMSMFGTNGLPELALQKIRLPHEAASPQAEALMEGPAARLDMSLTLPDGGSARVGLYFGKEGSLKFGQ